MKTKKSTVAKAMILVPALLALTMSLPALSQVTEQTAPFSSTPNPVGSGGRAIGWGSAFIAVADDATAASWNPGGLVQLIYPEASVVLSYHTRQEELDFAHYSTDDNSDLSQVGALNYASVAYPFHIGEINMVASLNYQRMYEFDRGLEYTTSGIDIVDGTDFSEKYRFDQTGALTTLTPAYCIQITPAWSLGVAANFWGLDDSGNGWEQQWQVESVLNANSVGMIIQKAEWKETYDMTGTNFVIGTHYKIQAFTIGAVYKTGWEADVKYKLNGEFSNIYPYKPLSDIKAAYSKTDNDQTIVWPDSYGIGLAYRYSDRLSFALDAYGTSWSKFKLKTGKGDEINLLGESSKNQDLKDTWQVHAGAEYLWILPKYVFALRGGAFYDPEQTMGEVHDAYGVALGGGMVYKNFVIDAAVQAKFANDTKSWRVHEVESDMNYQDYEGIVSLIYHFE